MAIYVGITNDKEIQEDFKKIRTYLYELGEWVDGTDSPEGTHIAYRDLSQELKRFFKKYHGVEL